MKNFGKYVEVSANLAIIVVIGVRGTPILILVDGDGKVTDVWVGALQPGQEEEVLGRLRS